MDSREFRSFSERKRLKRTNAAYLGDKRFLPLETKHISWVLDHEWYDYQPSLATGFRGVDSFARLNAGAVALLASRSREEKRALAQNIALHAADQGAKVLYCSLEEDRRAIAQMLLSIASGLPLSALTRNSASWYRVFNTPEWDQIAEADEKLATSGIYLCDDPNLDARSLGALVASVDSIDSPMLVIVDCVQPPDIADRDLGSQGEPADLSTQFASLNDLAKKTNVAVLGLVDLPQAVLCADPACRLTFDDLRAAGLGEKDASVVMILDEREGGEEDGELDQSEWRTRKLTITKTNGMAVFETPILFNPKTLRFADSPR